MSDHLGAEDRATMAMLGELLVEICHPCDDDVDLTSITFGQLGLDSLAILELLMLIDERTGVEVPVESIHQDTTLGQLAKKINSQASG